MKLNKPNAEFYIPDGSDLIQAIKKTTHMALAAHQDDIEIMAYDGILKGFNNTENNFFGVVVTDGAGSVREGKYSDYSDEMMKKIRCDEQKKAAVIGEYGALAMLNYPSKEIKDPSNSESVKELSELIKLASPEIIYTHNLADKHDTHIGVTTKVIAAIRALDFNARPKALYGCEVWRDLDWMVDREKVMFDVSERPNIASSLVEVFDSQIIGGKRYDLATQGRRLAHATFSTATEVDQANALIYAMDLTPLIKDDTLDIESYVLGYINRFKDDVADRIRLMIRK